MPFSRLLPLIILVGLGLGWPVHGAAQLLTCITTPPPVPAFVPPFPYTGRPLVRSAFSFGTDALWTWLPREGKALRHDKSFWFHPGFNGQIEPHPDLEVVATEQETGAQGIMAPASNALVSEDLRGWAMVTQLDFSAPGCWHVTGTYQGATVSYTVAVD